MSTPAHFVYQHWLSPKAMGRTSNFRRAVMRAGKTEIGIVAVIATTAIALLLLTASLAIGFNYWVRNVDDIDRARERQLAMNYLDRNGRASIAQQKVQLTWDDAFKAVGHNRDTRWADAYIGDFLWTNFKYDHLFLVEPQGELIRAWTHGHAVTTAGYAAISDEVQSGLRRIAVNSSIYGHPAEYRKLADTSWPYDERGRPLTRWTTALIAYNGQPAILTVASVLPDTDFSLLRRTPNHLVTVRYLDREFLASMSETLLLKGISLRKDLVNRPTENSVRLIGSRGEPLGLLHWQSMPLSTVLHNSVTPLFVVYLAFLFAVLGGGGAIVRALMLAMRGVKASEAQAHHNSMHDAMTGLPNRDHFFQHLAATLEVRNLGDDEERVIVAYFDLDHFKYINDTLGHHIGDGLICEVARRAREELDAGDFLARIGGDEFVLTRVARRETPLAASIGSDIIALFDRPFDVHGQQLEVFASCGVSWAPRRHGEDAGELLRNADIALYRAKQRGRGRWRCFTPDMEAAIRWRHDLEVELRKAIVQDEMDLVYQPIVAARDGSIAGFEALLRWDHAERGMIGPDVFVPIAEQGGLMTALGNAVLRRAFSDMQAWPEQEISINLSPLQIMARGFLQDLRDLIAESGIDPHRVIFEITEGVLLDRSAHVLTVLGDLKQMGFRIALDDFGTGFSSLSYLRSFPFDRIKIDRSFVQNIENDLDALAILKAIVALGQTLRMKIVAEGVETLRQSQLVQSAGCQLMQGHLFWHGLSPAQVSDLLVSAPESRHLLKRA